MIRGHAISQRYVAKYLSADTRREIKGMVGRITAEYPGRIERNAWLMPDTRAEAVG